MCAIYPIAVDESYSDTTFLLVWHDVNTYK